MQTVFHVSEVEAYRTAKSKVRNLLGDEQVDIDEVAVLVDHSTVIDAAAADCNETTAKLVELGATVKLCSNAGRGADVGAGDFEDGIEFVSSGVGELTRLQNQGWAYIRL